MGFSSNYMHIIAIYMQRCVYIFIAKKLAQSC